MNISIVELDTLDQMLCDYDDRIEVVEALLSGELEQYMTGEVKDMMRADDMLDDLEIFHHSRELLLRLYNESTLKI